MSLGAAGLSEPVRPVSGGGYDSVRPLSDRQVHATYSATGDPNDDVFLPAPQFAIARAIGLGRNIDEYA